MKEAQPRQNISPEMPLCCSQCGWPGTGVLPAGVSVIRQNGKTVLDGKPSYFHINAVLCSLCQEMEAAMASRPWFVKAQAEYSCTQECPPVGTSLHVLFNYSEGEVRARAIVRNLATSRGMGLAIVSMEQEHRARLDRLLQRLAAE